MHILQISETLPDRRVEKTINSDYKLGNKVSYIGLKVDSPEKFSNVHILNMTLKDILYNNNVFREKLGEIITEIDPDIIHAHDIYLGIASIKQGYPVVYNDHEFHSMKEKANNPLSTPWTRLFLKRKISWFYRYYKLLKWEEQLFKNSAIIVANKNVAQEHRKRGASTFLMPNFPTLDEVKGVWEIAKNSEREFDVTYVGNDMGIKSTPYRQGHKIFNIITKNNNLLVVGDRKLTSRNNCTSIGYVKHNEIYKYMVRAKTGILAWKPHKFHFYCSPNKIYFYIHSGTTPIIPYTLKTPKLENCFMFKKINEIPDLIERAKRYMDTNKVLEEAKEYLWEKNEEELRLAYLSAQEIFSKSL